ncbi:MAG TPA: hypothetical protein VFW73_09925, partial [Lacipirellulaceae bacterium]|nr:hypothetical protein [Lacipirellulaceae bacterium]
MSTQNCRRAGKLAACIACALILAAGAQDVAAAEALRTAGHPRLYFTAADLPRLRSSRASGIRAHIWANMIKSADWCAMQVPRTEWIPTAARDPQFENLYDRFYAAMHDAAIVEHLAFTSALSQPDKDPYVDPARRWLLATAKTWRNEAHNKPDASKAYAVLRVVKALAVGYDVLFDRLTPAERDEVRDTITATCGPYDAFFQDPTTAGPGYNKHHGSVDAAPFGVAALALLGDVNQASAWLDLAVKKHVDYLLPYALTPSGASDQSSNFWASTLQYRIFFCDPLRRVTGRDLFAEFPRALPGRIALAAIAAGQPASLEFNQENRSVLFGPSYGQINYWSPVLLYLGRRQRRPIYQYLALWDKSLGSLQRTRYITPHRREELLFCLGPYAYLWYDATLAPAIEQRLPYSFEFPEPEVNEAYLRASYEPGGIVVGMRKGGLVVHAGGRPVFVDQFGGSVLTSAALNSPPKPVADLLVTDDGRRASIRCVGPQDAGIGEQWVELDRPVRVSIHRETDKPLAWWYAEKPERHGNSLTWADGTKLTVTRGSIVGIDPKGYTDATCHYAGMKYADPHPFTY